jgi:putative ABC transport system permease protein
VILSNGLWQRRFASDPAIIGKTMLLDGKKYDIVGAVGREESCAEHGAPTT